MQTTVHKMDSASRYNNNETVSSHGGTGTFVGNNGGYRNNGQHNESSRGLNQNSSYGAQFNSSADNKVKNQNYGCENDSNTESPYSGWQSLNSSVNSSSTTNNWNIPDGKPVMGRSIHSNRDNSVNKEENMAVDNDSSFSGLLGATGGSDEKSNSSNNFAGNSSRSMQIPRLGLLGGGESTLVSQPSTWSGNQGPNNSAWGGVNRQNNSSDMTGNSNSDNMLVDGDMNFNGILNASGGSEFSESKQNGSNNYRQDHAIPPPRMGLLGGGEGNTSSGWVNSNTSGNGGSGWGTNARTSTNNSVTDLSCSSGSGTSTKPQGSWAQAAGKGLNPSLPPNSLNGSSGQSNTSPLTAETPGQHDNIPSARDRAEQEAKEFHLKAAFSEGWGQNSVNQDSPWDVPVTPPPENGKENQSAVWRAPVNMGTEIWENNLRMNKGSGSSVPAQTTAQPPWGHTPASNIGGHWGDDDSSNMWSGVPPNNATNPANWSDSNTPNNNMWGNPVPSEKHWGGSQSSWGDGACGSEAGSAVWPSSNKSRPISNWSPITTPKKEMPPSGWEPPSPPPNRRAVGGSYDDGTSVWGNPQRQGKVSHWKDMPSAKPIMNSNTNIVGPNGMLGNMAAMPQSGPGMIRLPSTKNDGNSWGKQAPPPNRNSNWQDMPPHRDSPTVTNWGDDGHMHNQMKNMPNIQGGPYGVGSWNDQSNNSLQYWGAKPKSNCNWADGQVDTSSWLGPAKQGGKPLCKDIVHASKQFRILTELGFRKEDVENALRNNNMNLEDAAAELQAMNNGVMDVDGFAGRKVRPANMYDDMTVADNSLESNFTSNNFHGNSNFQSGLNFSGVGGHSFKQQPSKGPTGTNNIINSALGGQQSNSGSVGNLSPALIQKILQQQQQQQQQQQTFQIFNVNNVQAFGNMKFPTNSHLRHLVQQIQMAVQAGHLNAQILNQPLAPQTLQFLYQLLQQIKVLTQLQQQQILQNSHMPKQGVPNASTLQLNVQIAQTKQRINNLQNQICANQALYLKQIPQQQPPLQPPHHASQVSADIFKANMEAMPTLHSEFRDLSIKDIPHQNAQSRLNQWKLSSNEKEDNPMCPPADLNTLGGIPDFSRAPGSMNSKATSSVPSSGSTLHPLLDQNDSTWSGLTGRTHGDSGWPEVVPSSTDSTNGSNTSATSNMGNGQPADNKDSTPVSGSSHPSYNLTDLVPEFEPGKPWKGTQLKNIEDDPHITPGSIARSPLSVNNIKESNLFWPSKTSPANASTDATGSLTSSTWVFNPSSAAGPNGTSGTVKSGSSKSGWGSDFGTTSDLWGSVSKSRNPPPGIANQGWDRPQNSTFLILRNLTPQIDGSTLKTLCMQHGPLQMFHLFQNGGVALVRYSTREEASKAQSALNNCVLGNTTMLADIPSDSEIQQYLQVSSGQAANNNTTWSSSTNGGGGGSGGGSSTFHGSGTSAFYGSGSGGSNNNTNWNGNVSSSQLWSFSNSSLWGSSQPSNDHDASTNPMNSYLPGDLLGGEPM